MNVNMMLKGIFEIVNAQASLLQAQPSWRQEFPFVVATGTPSDAGLCQFYGKQLGFYDFLISDPLRHANILLRIMLQGQNVFSPQGGTSQS